MRLEHAGVVVDLPPGWEARARTQPPREPGGRGSLLLHAATVPLPPDRGDFGSGVVDLLGPDDVFVALVDYGSEVADVGLFANQGMPRLAPSQFGPNRLQRPLPGLSASQHFFSEGGRAFCLFTVLGSHARRMATVQRAAALVRTVRITDRDTLARQGGRP